MSTPISSLQKWRDLVVETTHQRGAHRARCVTLWPEHVAVHHEGVVFSEEIREPDVGPVLGHEVVVMWNLAAGWKVAPQRCNALLVAPQLDLFDE